VDTFILRKESPVRQNIIELLMEWMEITVSVGFSPISEALLMGMARGRPVIHK